MKIWRRVEKSCQVHRDGLLARVIWSTTYGGTKLWNPHHYRLDAFERKTQDPAPGSSTRGRQPRTTLNAKRLHEEMASAYEDIAVNMGALM